MTRKIGRAGLSLVELLVAVIVLSVGILGIAAGSGWIIRMVDVASLDTERAVALQSAVEEMKSIPLADLTSGSTTQGEFTTNWSVTQSNAFSATVRFVLVGPGRSRNSGIAATITSYAADTLVYVRNR